MLCRIWPSYSMRMVQLARASKSALPSFHFRPLSTKNVFGNVDLSLTENLINIPTMPIPPVFKLSIQDLYQSGQSVINELELFYWWKPSGYFRYALEYIHLHFDVPWWTTIICGTCLLRLALIYVPIMSQKFVARQSALAPELNVFRDRVQEAKKENNTLLMQQILIDQRDFLRSKNVRYGRQFLILGINGSVFLTQFFAIKKMVAVNFPGFSTGGTLWFPDLTACDPYYILPIISSASLSLVMRMGVESGTSTDSMTPFMRVGMQYGLPLLTLIMASQFSSGICLYWCTSNAISLLYSGLFKIPVIRNALSLPVVVKNKKKENNSITKAWKNFKDERNAPPMISKLREEDAKTFKKAGRGKPVVKVN